MNKKTELIFAIITIVLVSFSLLALAVGNIKLREQIYQERLAYKDVYYCDLIDTLEDYYENEIYWVEKYYETKIELLDKETINISEIMNDLDDLMEWTIRYYEVEAQTLRDAMELTEYILWKDSKLYERILNWWQ